MNGPFGHGHLIVEWPLISMNQRHPQASADGA
jgi:hypothetical protein